MIKDKVVNWNFDVIEDNENEMIAEYFDIINTMSNVVKHARYMFNLRKHRGDKDVYNEALLTIYSYRTHGV